MQVSWCLQLCCLWACSRCDLWLQHGEKCDLNDFDWFEALSFSSSGIFRHKCVEFSQNGEIKEKHLVLQTETPSWRESSIENGQTGPSLYRKARLTQTTAH